MFNNLLRWLPAVTLTAIAGGSVVADDAAWPLVRHDPRNTARSPLVGTMTSSPESRARYPLGGAPDAADCLFADLDGDGAAELFLLGSAPGQNSQRLGWLLSFRDGFAEPRQLWGGLEMPFNPHYRPHTVVADIDADGRLEIVVARRVARPGYRTHGRRAGRSD